MTINPQLFVYINILLVIYLIYCLLRGYKKGLLMQLIDLTSIFVAFIAAWLFADMFAQRWTLSGQWISVAHLEVAAAITRRVDSSLWFLIIFVVVRLLLLLLRPLVAAITKVPFVRQLNSLSGLFFAVMMYAVKILLLCFMLTFPFFYNGEQVIEKTWLHYLYDPAEVLLSPYVDALDDNVVFQDLISGKALSDVQRQRVFDWLTTQGISEDQINGFLDGLQ